MNGWWRRVTVAFTAVSAIMLSYAVIYQWGMAIFAGENVSLLHSLRIVVESLTTAGFGGDTDHWDTTGMHIIVIAMNVTGVLLVFLGLPLFAVPLFRKALQTEAPTTSGLTDHVIICSYSERDEVLHAELESVGVPYLYIEEKPELVKSLVERDVEAIHGDPEKVETLLNANITEARALVADVDDETNPTIIISTRRANPDIPVVSVVEDYESAKYHRFAGADDVVQARQVLAESLAIRATSSLAEKFRDVVEVERTVRISEVLVEEGSDLSGRTLAEATVFDETGITVIGGWFGGKFIISPRPDMTIEENSILLVAGEHDHLEELNARPLPDHDDGNSRIVVCGYGSVGRAVTDELEKLGADTTVVDERAMDGVDIVGDITNPGTLVEAEVSDARAVILAIDIDTPTIYASIIVNQLAPDTEIIARADESESVWKLYNAGADYVLSLPSVTGELLASILIEEKEILTARSQFDFARMRAPALVGRTFADADIRYETGCTVVAVERDGELLTRLGGDFTVDDGDVLIAAGSEESLRRLEAFAHGQDAEDLDT